MSALTHPAKEKIRLSAVLFALSDPNRLQIVQSLATRGELTCTAVALPLCKSACSRHYTVLREAGIIRMRRSGTAFLNSLRREELDERFPGLLAAVVRPDADLSRDQ